MLTDTFSLKELFEGLSDICEAADRKNSSYD